MSDENPASTTTQPKKLVRSFLGRVQQGAAGDVQAPSWLELEATRDEAGQLTLKLSDRPPGNAGISGYETGRGVATNKDLNGTYRPYLARGRGRDLGLYHQAFLESQAYQDGWGKIEQGLTTSHWRVEPVAVEDEAQQERAKRQAQAVERVIFGLDGGWTSHVREALYFLIGGFAPFIKVTDGFGQLRDLSFRYPSQVQNWLTDEWGARAIGIEFCGVMGNGPYVRFDHELLLYQFRAIGNDFEGISPMRAALIYIEAHKLFMQLEAVAAEKYGAPTVFIERGAEFDAKDDEALLAILDELRAAENPIVLLPNGYKATLPSPSGTVPDFEPVKRYCDEKIATLLAAEGALIGLNGKGAYNLAEIKDDQQLRALAYYAQLICETWNNRTKSGSASTIEQIVRALEDPALAVPIEGQLPRLAWALSPEQDDSDLATILSAKQAGALNWGEEDEAWLRAKLKLPARAEPAVAVTGEAP